LALDDEVLFGEFLLLPERSQPGVERPLRKVGRILEQQWSFAVIVLHKGLPAERLGR